MTIPTESLSWHAETKTFSVFASDFGPIGSLRLSKFIPHGTDRTTNIGLFVVSHKTGKTARFYLDKEHVVDGELKSWYLRPTAESIRQTPELDGVLLIVYND